jgi:3',5'-cyclic-AMP phosphodiesterase
VLIAQLSDPHIVETGELLLGGIDTAACFRAAVDHLNGLEPAPDLVLLTGDLVNDGAPAQYEHLATLLAPLVAPVHLLPGNHDQVGPLRAAFPEQVHDRDGRADGVIEGDVRLVLLDSSRFPDPGGDLAPDQLRWLDEVLGLVPDRPTIVALHHPPFASGIAFMDEMALARSATEGLEAVLARHPQVERVLCGHLHRSVTRRFGGTVAMSCPGTAHAVNLDLGDGPPSWSHEPPAMLVHQWTASGGLVSHLQVIGDPGAVAFEVI